MINDIELYYITGNIIEGINLNERKFKPEYKKYSEKFNVLCVKINDKFYSLDADIVFIDLERNIANQVKRKELKKIAANIGEYYVIKKVNYENPTITEFAKALKIFKENITKKAEKNNVIGFPFEKITPTIKIKRNKILEFPKNR